MAWGFFSRNRGDPSREGSESLRRAVEELSDRLASVERTVRSLQLEWSETYDKVNRLMHRITKRVEADKREGQQDPPEQRPPEDPRSPLAAAAAMQLFRRPRR